MTKVSENLAKALAIEVSKDSSYEDVYQAAIKQWTQMFMEGYTVEELEWEYSERYDYIFEDNEVLA